MINFSAREWHLPVLYLSLVCSVLLVGCSLPGKQPLWLAAVAGDGPGQLEHVNDQELVVVNLPKSRQGNPPEYSVFGQRYRVMDSAQGFRERGEASWYGKKFHGRPTSSGEVYDMHLLTAAHKHLPLPTYVRVTRVDNGQSLVVKVNDRGPFVDDRIIDLSYAAAARLDMLEGGKAEVVIEALSSHEPSKVDGQAGAQMDAPERVQVREQVREQRHGQLHEQVGRQAREQAGGQVHEQEAGGQVHEQAGGQMHGQAGGQVHEQMRGQDAVSAGIDSGKAVSVARYVQVGAYSQALNAQSMLAGLDQLPGLSGLIMRDPANQLYRVLIGPLASASMVQQTRDSLAQAGIDSYTVTTAIP